MATFSHIVIIYNPNSTGPSHKLAEQLQVDLGGVLSTPVELLPTKRAGHAEQLAYDYAHKYPDPLIVSSSGDGGYHEVVNGALRAQLEGARPVCAVLPAGNANDHRRTIRQRPLAESIKLGKTARLDVLQASIQDDSGATTRRYAHSYIGLGLTPTAAVELNRHTLNALRELAIVLKTFWGLRPFAVRIEGQELVLDSLLMSNINQMAKLLTLDDKGRPDDGMFEINSFPHGHKLRLLWRLAKAALFRLKPVLRVSSYSLETVTAMPMQMDGEVVKLKAGSKVTVTVVPGLLRTLL